MNKMSPVPALRRSRTSVAILLAYLVLFTPLAPVSAQVVKVKRAPAPQGSPQPGKGKEAPGGQKTVTLPTALAAPNITATKVDAFPSHPSGQAEPGDTITYTVTITNNGPDPATGVQFTDTVDPNTSLVPSSITTTPIANADSASAFGNVRISTANGAPNLLANDCDPDPGGGPCTNTGLTASGPTTSTNGGNVVVNSDGSFSYNPAPGYTGTDTFTYTATDGAGKTDTATVTITVGPTLVWFINNDPAAPAGNDGRITSPFNSIASYNASAPTKDPNDIIFIYQGTSAYTGNLTLTSGMKLIGQGYALQTETGAPPAGSDALPGATANPVINSTAGNTVTLNTNNTIRGLTLNDSAGIDLTGTSFGTLTVSNVTLSGTGRALSLTTGTLAATFDSITSTSSTGGQGILIQTNVAGTMTVTNGTTITNPATQGILVTGCTASINFGNTSVTGGTDAISLSNNSAGTRTFGTITTSGNSGVAFLHSTGGGTTNVTGATTITNPGGVGIDVDSSNADLTFAATTVNKNSTGGIGVDLTNNATRTIGFTSLTVTTTNAFALNTNNSGTVNSGGGSLTQSGAGGGAASLTNTTLGLTFTSVSSDGGGNGLIFSSGSGTFASGTTNLQNNAGIGLLMSSSGVAANFGNTTVNSSAGDAVDLASNTGAITFAALNLTPDSGLRGLDAQSNTNTITSTSGTISTTNASAINIAGVSAASLSPLAMTLTSVSANVSAGTTQSGVSLTNTSGTLTMQGGSITGGNAAAFLVNSGTANITYNGTISQANAFRVIDVQNKTGGTVAFGGQLTAAGANSTGIFLNVNTGATINFTGGINLSTGANAAFTATGGGTVNATQNNTSIVNTLTTTTGTALNVTNTFIGASGLTFRSINSPTSSANNAVILNTTGTTAGTNGGLTITGNGGTCTSAGTCTGGNIANKTGADASTTQGTGIFLNSTRDISLTNVFLNDFQNFAIYGSSVTNFTFTTSIVSGTNGTSSSPTNEGCVRFDGLLGNALITGSSIGNTNTAAGATNALHVNNASGTLTLLDIQSSTIFNQNASSAPGASGQDAFFFGSPSGATGVMNLRLNNSSLTHARQFLLQVNIQGTKTANLEITNNTLHNQIPSVVNAGGGSNITGGGTDVYVKYLISGNSFRHTPGVTNGGRSMTIGHASGSAAFDGKFLNNTIGQTGVVSSGAGNAADGLGIFASGNNSPTMGGSKALIQGNTIQRYGEAGILVNARQGNATLDVT
ncbi:MAG: cadherin-like domain-containing protein, partial [Acidobacteria bacterium]|nr:cadherin-like domain-containing protein [Acidobacteriota bacterium]